MTTPLPDDHYAALGVAKDATAAAIKLAYRKLVLKHHPDKVDEADKTAAADRFHKIQTAWEALGEDEKRSRYDAHVKLALLRREKELAEKDRFTTPDYRAASFRHAAPPPQSPTSSPRAPPSRGFSYVEVKPSFDANAFDRLRTSDRKDFDYDHDRRRRTPPKEDRYRAKPVRQDSKETERARHREKGRQATKATNRDRDAKYSYARVDATTDSDSDGYFERRSPRDLRAEDRAREQYLEQARIQAEEQRREARSNNYMDERSQKLFSDAQDYQQRMRAGRGHTETRRPSPTRMSSSREHVEYTRGADGRPAAVRRSSQRPRTSSRDDLDAMRSSRRGSDRESYRSSAEYDDAPRRPPTLNQTKSAPNEIRLPHEKQRSNSVQFHSTAGDDLIAPQVRRADSMPHAVSKERNKPVRQSTLRQTQTTDDYDSRRSPTRPHYHSRSGKDYDDQPDSPVRDPYLTEVREPVGRRMTRSPSPLRTNEKTRSSSNRFPVQPPHLSRTTSTTYNYPLPSGADVLTSRPKLSRGDSGRKDSHLFGEITSSRSSRDRDPYASDNVRIRETRPDVKIATGYTASRRTSENRSPGYYTRANSYSTPTVSA